MSRERAYVALGSNLGDRTQHLRRALDSLDQNADTRVVRVSSLYETAPIGPPQGAYLNAVVELVTALAPVELLDALRSIEDAGGRERTIRWGPRTIDLDILDYANRILDTGHLRLPHPEMTSRGFVLIPLGEIAPGWIHPVTGRSVEAHTESLGDARSSCIVAASQGWWRGESRRGCA